MLGLTTTNNGKISVFNVLGSANQKLSIIIGIKANVKAVLKTSFLQSFPNIVANFCLPLQ
jgi:hypothetical protein